MNLVFLNRLERRTEDNERKEAVVAIGEQEGTWRLIWEEPKDGGRTEEQIWYEGAAWDELLSLYRVHLSEKMGEGFRPLIEEQGWSGADALYRQKLAPVLDCYSETRYNESVFIALRQWRREQSAKEEKAPYLIASNRLLRAVAAFLPYTEDELLQLPGWGEMKAGKYGDRVLEIARQQERKHEFPLDWVRHSVSEEEFVKWMYRQREMKYRQQLEQKKTRDLIAEMVRERRTLTEMQDTLGLARRELLLRLEELVSDGLDAGDWIAAESSEIPAEETDKAIRLFAEVGDRYLKPVMMRMYDDQQRKHADLDHLYERLRILRMKYRHESGLAAASSRLAK